MDVLLVEFLAQSLKLTVFLLHLLCEIVDDLLKLIILYATLTNLLLQLVDKLLVLLHRLLDELHVLADTLCAVGALTLLGESNTALSLGNLTESLLDVAQGGHHVGNLTLLLSNNRVQGVTLSLGCEVCLFNTIVTTGYCQCTKCKNC